MLDWAMVRVYIVGCVGYAQARACASEVQVKCASRPIPDHGFVVGLMLMRAGDGTAADQVFKSSFFSDDDDDDVVACVQ